MQAGEDEVVEWVGNVGGGIQGGGHGYRGATVGLGVAGAMGDKGEVGGSVGEGGVGQGVGEWRWHWESIPCKQESLINMVLAAKPI